jgi:hypothetical protein
VSVAVVPSPFVTVVAAGRDQAVQHFRQVTLEAGLELDRADGRCAAHAEYLDDACFDAGAPDDGRNLVSQIVHLPVAGRLEGELLLVDHSGY